MQPILVSEAAQSDCGAISEVVLSSFTCAALQDQLSPDQMTSFVREVGSEEAIRRRFGECRFTVARLEDEIVGVAGVREDQLIYLFVTPINQRSGIGSQLFRAAEQAIKAAGIPALSLMTIFSSSIPFFTAIGMEEAGECEVFLGPDCTARGMMMRKLFEP
jgi:N-acetylglutamate synthase-like GNAT family acetyltransferase